jgi:hypothetical protein
MEDYNDIHLSTVPFGCMTPKDKLVGPRQEIETERHWRLEAARQQRKNRRQRTATLASGGSFLPHLHKRECRRPYTVVICRVVQCPVLASHFVSAC